jgi:hypothetical protein
LTTEINCIQPQLAPVVQGGIHWWHKGVIGSFFSRYPKRNIWFLHFNIFFHFPLVIWPFLKISNENFNFKIQKIKFYFFHFKFRKLKCSNFFISNFHGIFQFFPFFSSGMAIFFQISIQISKLKFFQFLPFQVWPHFFNIQI